MSFTKQEREELKALSKEVFNNTGFWRNKLYKKYPLDTFEQLKARILEIQVNTAKILQQMKDSKKVSTPEGLFLTGWHDGSK